LLVLRKLGLWTRLNMMKAVEIWIKNETFVPCVCRAGL
jgi:hypothetical protein